MNPRKVIDCALIAACGLLAAAVAIDLYVAFFSTGPFLAHDEAEHLHVVHALARGERPYIDFIENHPVLPHALLARYSDIPGSVSTIGSYIFLKRFVLLYCVGTFALLAYALRPILHHGKPLWALLLLFLTAASSLGAWDVTRLNEHALSGLWNLRPDWACYFHAIVCVWLHYESTLRTMSSQEHRHELLFPVLAGINGGIATAILAKSAFIFIPYAVAWAVVALVHPNSLAIAKICWRKLTLRNVAFVSTLLGTFLLLVAWELGMTGVGWSEYYKANFLYNTVKHLLYSSLDFNPFYTIGLISGLGLWQMIVGVIFVVALLLHALRAENYRLVGILTFLIALPLINAMLPAFSNGAGWGQYFMPSLIASVMLLVLTVDRLWWGTELAWRQLSSPYVGAIAAGAVSLLCMFVSYSQLLESQERLENMYFLRNLYHAKTGDHSLEFFPDRYLPSELSYLTFSPKQKPVRARAWGYYFMLSPDLDSYSTMNKLGLGPDYESASEELFRSHPPDVVLLADIQDLAWRSMSMYLANNGSLDWMLYGDKLNNYRCLSHSNQAVQVRLPLVERFRNDGWHPCSDLSFGSSPGADAVVTMNHVKKHNGSQRAASARMLQEPK